MEVICVTQLALHIAATTPLTELHSSHTASNLE